MQVKASIEIKKLSKEDISKIVEAFEKINWHKPASIFEHYLQEQQEGMRCILLAYKNDCFAGYITLKWDSEYSYFKEQNIPEIKDLNVLPSFQRQGIGSFLLDSAEKKAQERGNKIGLGVVLTAEYGPAQRLYVQHGYVPDGRGVTDIYSPIKRDQKYSVDNLHLWLIKNLN